MCWQRQDKQPDTSPKCHLALTACVLLSRESSASILKCCGCLVLADQHAQKQVEIDQSGFFLAESLLSFCSECVDRPSRSDVLTVWRNHSCAFNCKYVMVSGSRS